MEQIKKRWFAKPLSLYLAIAIAFTSLVLSLATGREAHAQTTSHLPIWAVLDFTNTTKYGGSDIGREAGDALVIELGNSNRFNVITRGDVATGLNTLGIQPPLDSVDIQRVGKQINADAIVTGEVLAITQKTDPAQVQAVVAVRVTDTTSGELINGALAEGLSTPHPGAAMDQDTMVNDALSKAAFAAVKQITAYQLPEPTIINNEGPNTVLLNMGARDGIQPGMNLLVRRNGIEVGRVRVGEVEDDESTAVVTQSTLGVRPGDHARAIYSLPAYDVRGGTVVTDSGTLATGNAVRANHSNKFSGVGGLLIAILAAGLLIALVGKGGRSGNLGGGNSGGVTARSAWGSFNFPSYAGFGADIEADPTLQNLSSLTRASYGIRVTWSAGDINPTSIIGFNVYRNSFEQFTDFVASTGSGTTTSTGSTSTSSSTSTSTSTSTAGTTSIFQFEVGPIHATGPSDRTYYDDGQTKTVTNFLFIFGLTTPGTTTSTSTSSSSSTSTSTSSSSSSSSSSSTGSSSSSTSSSTSTSTSNSSGSSTGIPYYSGLGEASLINIVPGVPLGQPQTYAVTAVYQITVPTATGPVQGYQESPVQTSFSGLATALLPVDVLGTSSDVAINGQPSSINGPMGLNFSSVLFSFETSLGPNVYIVDVSNTYDFKKKVTLGPIFPGTNQAGASKSLGPINLRSSFPGATQLFFRFGSRNAADNPGPVDQNSVTPNPTSYPQGGQYIYSLTAPINGS